MDDRIKVYWNEKFKKKKEIWGEEPSVAAQETLCFLKEIKVLAGSLLDVGCGYGRDANFFKKNGYSVTGIDFSEEAIKIAHDLYPSLKVDLGSVEEMSQYESNSFDIVFGNFLLHLFDTFSVRKKIILECYRVLKSGGYIFQSLASVEDCDYGKGTNIGEDLFINERGVCKYYYSKKAVKREFDAFSILQIKNIEEAHLHDKPHTHKSYLVIAQKK